MRSAKTILLAGCLFICGCGNPDKLWEEGNYRVYVRPNSREIIMGYHFGDGGVLGLSESTVTAAGADARHIVFKVNASEYFYIVREPDSEGITHGPLTEIEFANLASKIPLPPFQWHLKP